MVRRINQDLDEQTIDQGEVVGHLGRQRGTRQSYHVAWPGGSRSDTGTA